MLPESTEPDLSSRRYEWQALRAHGGEAGPLNSYYLTDRRTKAPLVEGAPQSDAIRNALGMARTWFETDQPFALGSPHRYNHPEYFDAGTAWLKEFYTPNPNERYPLVGETKDNSLDSEARARGESMNAEAEDEDGETYFPAADAAADAAAVVVAGSIGASHEGPADPYQPTIDPARLLLPHNPVHLLAWRVCDAWIKDTRGTPAAAIFDRQAPRHRYAVRKGLDRARARRQLRHVEAVALIDMGYSFDMSAARYALISGISERAFAKKFGVSLRQSRQYREALADLLEWDFA